MSVRKKLNEDFRLAVKNVEKADSYEQAASALKVLAEKNDKAQHKIAARVLGEELFMPVLGFLVLGYEMQSKFSDLDEYFDFDEDSDDLDGSDISYLLDKEVKDTLYKCMELLKYISEHTKDTSVQSLAAAISELSDEEFSNPEVVMNLILGQMNEPQHEPRQNPFNKLGM